jgi:hypothetical protein
MKKFIQASVMVLALTAVTATSASATTGRAMFNVTGTAGVGSNTAAVSGVGANLGAHTFTAGGGVVRCNDATFNITSITTTTAHFHPSYAGCNFTVAGTALGTATVDSPCTWTLHSVAASVFDTATGAGSGGSVSTQCSTTVTVPAAGCTIHVAQVAGATGISTQNVTLAGASTTTIPAPAVRITAAVSGLTYTTAGSCLIAEHGTGSYSGSVAVRNVYGSL